MTAIAYVLWMFPSSTCNGEEASALSIDVTCSVVSRDPDPEGDGDTGAMRWYMIVRTYVQNTAKTPITVPTSTYDGKPDHECARSDGFEIHYTVGYKGGKVQTVPSPVRFLPVTLNPGESAELPIQELRFWDPTMLDRVVVTYEVDSSFAERQNWWHGCLSKIVTPLTPQDKRRIRELMRISGSLKKDSPLGPD